MKHLWALNMTLLCVIAISKKYSVKLKKMYLALYNHFTILINTPRQGVLEIRPLENRTQHYPSVLSHRNSDHQAIIHSQQPVKH